MTQLRLLGAAVVLSTALAAPALAQQVIYNPGYCAQFYPNANCQNLGPGNPYTDGHQRAGAVATAPFRGDANAYYNNGDRSWSQSYAQRNGFVCQPGTWFRGEDGRQRICQ
ncbi:hypothetical protein [Bradyrhizobium sp.]|uniref:hypothetical protein n=1 Tax=Bradyrhizobium sp. TaxID=376 RepID=UPI0027343E84|nr:hypothetical protein [Bradyrhizobium sp.]MDP3694091.1 hypothetical protein [Bradyrhizobium sp.]